MENLRVYPDGRVFIKNLETYTILFVIWVASLWLSFLYYADLPTYYKLQFELQWFPFIVVSGLIASVVFIFSKRK